MQDRLQVLKEPAEAISKRLGEASNPFQSGNGLEQATLLPIDHSYPHTGHSQVEGAHGILGSPECGNHTSGYHLKNR